MANLDLKIVLTFKDGTSYPLDGQMLIDSKATISAVSVGNTCSMTIVRTPSPDDGLILKQLYNSVLDNVANPCVKIEYFANDKSIYVMGVGKQLDITWSFNLDPSTDTTNESIHAIETTPIPTTESGT